MFAGLSGLEFGRLRMSVGYGTHKKGRPLSPIEVGMVVKRAKESGVSLTEFAESVGLDGPGHIGRFLRILKLPRDLQHLISWGVGRGKIGFSCAVELVALRNVDDQRAVAEAILTDDIKSREVRYIGQLRRRSGRPIGDCIKEVIGMRPTIERYYVFIGSVVDTQVTEALIKLTQSERDEILESGIELIKVEGATGRLGDRLFTLVGDERFDASMNSIGKESIEARLRVHISKAVVDARCDC